MTTTTATIRTELAACRAEARAQGWTGDDADYEYTAEEMHAVVAAVGRKPTREEWTAAGLAYVGSEHCAS